MNAAEHVLQSLERDGFRVRVKRDRLYVSPRARLTEGHREVIRITKDELCYLLTHRPAQAPVPAAPEVPGDDADAIPPPNVESESAKVSFDLIRLIKTVPDHYPPDGLVKGAILETYAERHENGNLWVQCRNGRYALLEDAYWEPLFD